MELELQSWFTVIVGALVLVFVLLFRYVRRNDDYWKKRGIQYAPRQNIFYSLWKLKTTPIHELITESYRKYGRVVGMFMFSTPALSVSEPDLLRDILVKDFHVFSNRREFDFQDNLLNKMVSVLSGEDWKRVRAVITPAFTSKKMRKIAHIINSCSQTVVQTLSEHYEKGVAVDFRKVFGAFTMDVIASSAFATKIDSHNDPDNPFVVNSREASRTSFFRLLILILIPLKLWRYLPFNPFNTKPMEFFKSVTLQVIEERRKKSQKGNDFLQMMLDSSEEIIEGEKKIQAFQTLETQDEEDHYGRIDMNSTIAYTTKKLSQDEIVAQCVLFFMVGYETSALTLSYLAYNLALNLDCQEKLIKEIDEVFQKKDELTYDDIRDMKYLDGCLSESLRLFPPLIASERTAQDDYKLADTGIIVEKGMSVSIPIYAMHYDPENFSNPEKYDPERFIGENRQNLRPYTYLPFGAGPRNCLGMRFAIMEIKLCIANILRHYRFQRAPETKVPIEFAFFQGFLSTKELPLLVEKRTDVE